VLDIVRGGMHGSGTKVMPMSKKIDEEPTVNGGKDGTIGVV